MEKLKPYEKYKSSNIAWIGDIPAGWEVRKVKHIFTVQRGRVIANTDLIDSGLYPVYSSQTKNNGKLGCINTFDYDGEYISWTTDGIYAGTTFVRKGKFNATNICGLLKLKIDYKIEYFGYLFSHIIPYNKRPDTNGAKIMSNEMRDIFFVIPNKFEQVAINNFLDYKTAKIDRFIAKKKQLIKLLNEQKAGIINDAVTKGLNPNTKTKPSGIEWLGDIPEHWEVRKLKYVADCFPSNIDKHTRDDEKQVRLCNYTDVYKNDFIANDMNLMFATATDEQIEKFSLKIGDVVITKDSETANDIAVPAVVKEELENVVCGYHLSVLRPYSKLVGEYLFRVLQCKPINIQFELCSNGVTRVGLGVYDMKKAQVPIPPLSEQKLIVSHIEAETTTINKTIATIEKEIALVQEYRTALIAEAVTGKIDVREYQINEELKMENEEPEEDLEDELIEDLEAELKEQGEIDYQQQEIE